MGLIELGPHEIKHAVSNRLIALEIFVVPLKLTSGFPHSYCSTDNMLINIPCQGNKKCPVMFTNKHTPTLNKRPYTHHNTHTAT